MAQHPGRSRHLVWSTLIVTLAAGFWFWRTAGGPPGQNLVVSSATGTPAAGPARSLASVVRESPVSTALSANDPSRHRSLLEPILAFEEWLNAQRSGESASAHDGLRLARERRAALKALIATNPEAALQYAVSRTQRTLLPAAIRGELEEPIDRYGRYSVTASCFGASSRIDRFATIDGQRFVVHTFGRRLATLTKYRLPIHGIAIDDQLALSDTPYRLLEPGESGAVDGPGLTVAVGDASHQFDSPLALQVWRDEIASAEAALDPWAELSVHRVAALAAEWTLGEKRVLWIRVDFSDDPGSPITDDELALAGARMDQFFQDNSRGRCSMKFTALPVILRLPKPKSDYIDFDELSTAAAALARDYDAANGNGGTYNPDRYDRWILYSKRVETFSYGGIADIGGVASHVNGFNEHVADIGSHELGHNHGFIHSHGWLAAVNAAPSSEYHEEYGDVFDVMGSGGSGNEAFLGAHFNTWQKSQALFLDPGEVTTVSQSGVYRIFRHDDRSAAGIQAIAVAAGGFEYWLEHRQQTPSHEGFPFLDRLRGGVQIRWGKTPPYLFSNGPYLIDPTPESVGGATDAALIVGESFIDADHGITITPIAVGGAAPREWIDVRVDFGAAGTNRNPALSVSAMPAVVSARSDVRFFASAVDPDGDPLSYVWQFSDEDPPVRERNPTYRFPGGGDYTVRCSVNDGLGGVAMQEFSLKVVDPLSTWTEHPMSGFATSHGAVLHDGQRFVAVGSSVSTSQDGVTWTRGTFIGGYCYDMVFDGTRYVAAANRALGTPPNLTSVGAIFTSTNLVNWQSAVLPTPSGDLIAIAHGDGRFVVVGHSGAMFRSDDGVNWQTVETGVTEDFRGVAHAGGKFVAVAPGGILLVSTDGGATWTPRSLPFPDNLNNVVYHRGEWIVLSGLRVWKSSDTETWTPHDVNALLGSNALASLGNPGILLNSNKENEFQISEDGVAWHVITFSPAGEPSVITAACEHDGIVVAVGFSGLFLRSSFALPVTSAPTITSQPQSTPASVGAPLTLSVAVGGSDVSYRWTHNGLQIAGALQPSLVFPDFQPSDSGLYTAIVTESIGGTSSISPPAIVGITSDLKLVGAGTEYPDIVHAETGKTYDQLLLGGAAAAFTADSALDQITRLSFIDLNDDIVQVEYAGPGTVSIVLEASSGPAAPVNYNQATDYMKGHAGIVITGATERSNLTVFTVGRGTASNQLLFRSTATYDGIADISFIAIQSPTGKFGGLRAANASFWNTRGHTGVFAPGIQFNGPVYVHDIDAHDDATPVLMIGSALGNTWITGGDLHQTNDRAVQVAGLKQLHFKDGTTSHYRADEPFAGQYLFARANSGRLESNGVDLTNEIVVNP